MLNTEQQQVVDSNAKQILVLAGAGTGKTTVLISRVARLVASGVKPTSILGLTFTNAAASEMRERYKQICTTTDTPMFCTFHAFCYSLIIQDTTVRNAIGYKSIPDIAKDADLKRIEMSVKAQCGVKLSHDTLMRNAEPASLKERMQYRVFRKQYEKKLKQENLITFDIMCYEVGKLFVDNVPCIRQYKDTYKYIFVDEFQDTDQKQWDFVSSFADANLLVVGDAKQNLYSFRGSTSAIIKRLSQDSNWKTIKLSQNYRSTSQICDFSNKLHAWGDSPYNLAIHSDRSGCDVVMYHRSYDGGILTDEEIKVIQDSIHAGETAAVLCRSNAEVKNIINSFEFNQIPYITKQVDKMSDKEHILLSAIRSEHLISWLSGKLTASEYTEYIRMCTLIPKYRDDEMKFSEVYYKRFSEEFDTIYAIRKILNSECFTNGKVIAICNILKIHTTKDVALEQVNPNEVILKCIEYLKSNTAQVKAPIYIGTVHSVKGLEYDVVHLLGVGSKSFNLKDEEQYNIYYVGCTRAKSKLYVWKSM